METGKAPAPQGRRLPAPFRRALPVPVPPEEAESRLARFWPKFWAAFGKIPFAEELAAAWYAYADPETPARVKAVLAGALIYFVVPTDMLPDFVAGLGFTDDATVLATALSMVGSHIKRRHKQAARKLLRQDGRARG